MTSRDDALALDRADPLASLREEFLLPDEVIYLDGNSLGPLHRDVAAAVERVVHEEWAKGLIGSWNQAAWIELPVRVGDRIAPLIGAAPGQVLCCDSVSVNLFKLIAAAFDLRPGRRILLSDHGNFPTDLYVAGGAARVLGGGRELRLVDREAIEAGLVGDIALLMLTHVDFRSGELHDMARLTGAAHDAGALVLWDLSHSVGIMPITLDELDVDFAVGGTYKFLNGGPGSPAFLYVARRHQQQAQTPIAGWLGHAAPFEFAEAYEPAPGIARFTAGTPDVIAMSAVEAALGTWERVTLEAVREKSIALTELFLGGAGERLGGLGFENASPLSPWRRGSQVSLAHRDAYAIVQALAARKVIGDFRAPDLLRFGFAPLYTRFVDAWDAVEQLASVVETREFEREEYRARAAVT
jgi:kynureninase